MTHNLFAQLLALLEEEIEQGKGEHPIDWTLLFALADLAEEQGRAHLAIGFRWAGKNEKYCQTSMWPWFWISPKTRTIPYSRISRELWRLIDQSLLVNNFRSAIESFEVLGKALAQAEGQNQLG